MSITINSTVVPQPTILNEMPVQIQSENESIAGNIQRNRIGQKKQATLTYQDLSAPDYRTLMGFFTTGSGVIYYNDQSSETANGIYTFSGIAYFDVGDYVPGSSLLKDSFKVRIREQ